MVVANVTIVGMGPRGISVLERIGAAKPDFPMNIFCLDSSPLGAGAIWDTAQTRTLCMNTLAGAVTLFTEKNSTVTAPVQLGPTMYEWIQQLRGDADSPTYPLYESYPADASTPVFSPDLAQLLPTFADELAVTRPESNPSRALYGAYLRWCFEIAVDRLPANVTVTLIQARAVGIVPVAEGGRTFDRISLSDGQTIDSDATVLATGWLTPAPQGAEQLLAQSGLPWVAPANPIEQDLSTLPPASTGKKVLVRGAGMGFFDLMALVSIDRGGRFIEDTDAPGNLRYEPSGKEPHLVVTSGRGYPFLPKSEYGSLPPKAVTPAFDAVFADLEGANSPISFAEQVWPAILADARAQHPELDIDFWFNPLAGFTGTLEEVTAWITQRLEEDIRQARLAQKSPLKNALWVFSSVRKRVSMLGAGGRFLDPGEVSRFMAMGQMVGSGPPAFRSRQLLALVRAGLVSFAGADPTVRAAQDAWILESATIGKHQINGSVLVDAWMHKPDAFSTEDPLNLSLADRMRPFNGSGSPETDAATRLLVGQDGQLDPRVLLIGIPTGAQHPDTTISPMPGTNPLFLQETDQAAATLLDLARTAHQRLFP